MLLVYVSIYKYMLQSNVTNPLQSANTAHSSAEIFFIKIIIQVFVTSHEENLRKLIETSEKTTWTLQMMDRMML